MWIERIRLRDWKCFTDVTFDFPKPTKARPIVLIGAENGAGKTSLLEGLLFCLYGPLAIDLIGERESNMQRGTDGFRRFVSRAVNHTARSQGRTRASIEVTFADDDERIRIERRFHIVASTGAYRDQEVFVRRGSIRDEIDDLEVVSVPALADKDEYLRGFVAQNILPHNLAPFFFFDGEQVQRLATKDRSQAARDGLEQLMGVKILRTLQADLRTLASQRRSKGRVGTSPGKLPQLELEISKLNETIDSLDQERVSLEARTPEQQRNVDRLQGDIGLLVSGNTTNVIEIAQERHQVEADRRAALTELNEQLFGRDLAIALALRPAQLLAKQLTAETKHASWVAARDNMLGNFSKLLSGFQSADAPHVDPPLTDDQWAVLSRRLRSAYEGLFVPPPSDIAKSVRHGYLGVDNRDAVQHRLNSIQNLSLARIRALLERLDVATVKARQLRENQQVLAEGSQASELAARLRTAQAELTTAQDRVQAILNQLVGERSALAALLQERARYSAAAEKGGVENRVAQRCDEIAAMLETFIEELRRQRTDQLGEMMTSIYRSLARKEDVVRKIEVDTDGPVRLLGASNRNLSEQDLSAGENEIFALSLLYAAAQIAGTELPVVIDTPVARLDRAHRVNIAKNYLPKAATQVIVLSTDTELVGDYLDPIRGKIAKSYIIEFNSSREISVARPDAYFASIT